MTTRSPRWYRRTVLRGIAAATLVGRSHATDRSEAVDDVGTDDADADALVYGQAVYGTDR